MMIVYLLEAQQNEGMTKKTASCWGMQDAPRKDHYKSIEHIPLLDFYIMYPCCKQQGTAIK
jgi:hypothetical protein